MLPRVTNIHDAILPIVSHPNWHYVAKLRLYKFDFLQYIKQASSQK